MNQSEFGKLSVVSRHKSIIIMISQTCVFIKALNDELLKVFKHSHEFFKVLLIMVKGRLRSTV